MPESPGFRAPLIELGLFRYVEPPVIWRGIAFRFGNHALRGAASGRCRGCFDQIIGSCIAVPQASAT
jgi:hypothetical protein